MNDRRIYTSYLRHMLAAAACLFLLPVATSEFLKVHFGELQPAEIVRRQLDAKDTLYLSGLDHDVAAYKLDMAKAEKPDIIVVGSSRALQVRDFFFTAPFVNWGLAAKTVGQLEWATGEIAKLEKKPKLMIVFLDPWWFNEKHRSGKDIYVLQGPHLSHIYRNTYVLTKSLLAEKHSSHEARLGLGAIRSNQGFDYYGSFHYVARVTGHENRDLRFKGTLKRIDTQDDRFVGADDANPLAVARWRTAKAKLEGTGIRVVEILPPFASVVVDRLRSSGNYGYMWKLPDRLGGQVLDYTDPRVLAETSDCEFLDGFHAGEVINAKLLLDAAQRRPELRSLLDVERLRAWAAANRGLASPTTISLYGAGAKEVDFLHLGCSKAAAKQLN